MSDSRWNPEETEWAGWIDRIVMPGETLPELSRPIPERWRALLAEREPRAVIDAVWGEAEPSLPRFVSYLRQCATGIAIGDGLIGPVLIYFVQDWYDLGDRGLAEGELVAGLPTAPGALDRFEEQHGALPSSLRAFWERHASTRVKTDFVLASLEPSPGKFTSPPRVHEFGGRGYLAIADAWRSAPLCMIGEGARGPWRDEIVRAYPNEGVAHDHGNATLDALLVDWTARRWGRP